MSRDEMVETGARALWVARWGGEHGESWDDEEVREIYRGEAEAVLDAVLPCGPLDQILPLDDPDGCGGYLADCAAHGHCHCEGLGRE